jgi:hypothetical protein
MFISHKSNVLIQYHESEWQCRRLSKGISKPEYWTWIATITSGDPPEITYPSEDFTIIKINDENVFERLSELENYISFNPEGNINNIKVYSSKRNAEEILDIDGKSFSPKQYVSSHFVGDDTAKDERILADKWANVRLERNRKLAETDYLALSDSTLSNDMKNYRESLRDVPEDNADPDDISWPAKP